MYTEETQTLQVIFKQYFMYAFSHIFVDILPITVILCIQHKNYRKEKT